MTLARVLIAGVSLTFVLALGACGSLSNSEQFSSQTPVHVVGSNSLVVGDSFGCMVYNQSTARTNESTSDAVTTIAGQSNILPPGQ